MQALRCHIVLLLLGGQASGITIKNVLRCEAFTGVILVIRHDFVFGRVFFPCCSFFHQSSQADMGGSEAWRPLRREQLLSDVDQTWPRNVFLFSDGFLSEELSLLAAVSQTSRHVRVFTFGVG